MANLITADYFIREVNLPGNVLAGTLADINPYIVQYERDVLIDLLGYPLYKSLKAGIDAGSPDYGEVRWKRLITGHEYTVTYQGVETTVKWNGLINDEEVSLLSYFIFYYYLKDHTTFTSNRGELSGHSENAQAFNPGQRLVDAWNSGRDLYGKTVDDLVNPTAYNFLYNFKDDETNGYDGWIFTPVDHLNTFSL